MRLTDTTAYRKEFETIASRVFTPFFMKSIHGCQFVTEDAPDVDHCVQFVSDLLMSPPRLEAFYLLADPYVLAGMHARYRSICDALDNHALHATFSRLRSDGEIWRAFMLDLWSAFVDIPVDPDPYAIPDAPPWDD